MVSYCCKTLLEKKIGAYFVRISLAQVTFLRGAAVSAMPKEMTTNEIRVSSVICIV